MIIREPDRGPWGSESSGTAAARPHQRPKESQMSEESKSTTSEESKPPVPEPEAEALLCLKCDEPVALSDAKWVTVAVPKEGRAQHGAFASALTCPSCRAILAQPPPGDPRWAATHGRPS